MGILAVIVAAAAAWALGAAWYMALSKPWMEASGVRPEGTGSVVPFILSFFLLIVVAAMIRHVLESSGIATPGGGLVAGLGLGAFVATPWIAMNNLYGMRPARLTLIDGGYATLGCGLIGLVLGLF